MDNELETRAPGYRFYPTEEELLMFYLPHKLENTRPDVERVIPVLDVYNHHPRDLQLVAGEGNRRDPEQWFFFCPRQEREEQGGRPTRTTSQGYWKATGSPAFVFSSTNKRIGIKRTMVFYEGRAPSGVKTGWKMNEYKALQHNEAPVLRKEFSLCRVYVKTAMIRSFDPRPINPISNEKSQFTGEALTPDTNASPPPSQKNGSNKDALDLSVLNELGFDLDLNWF